MQNYLNITHTHHKPHQTLFKVMNYLIIKVKNIYFFTAIPFGSPMF
jgi:hypothetical protein